MGVKFVWISRSQNGLTPRPLECTWDAPPAEEAVVTMTGEVAVGMTDTTAGGRPARIVGGRQVRAGDPRVRIVVGRQVRTQGRREDPGRGRRDTESCSITPFDRSPCFRTI